MKWGVTLSGLFPTSLFLLTLSYCHSSPEGQQIRACLATPFGLCWSAFLVFSQTRLTETFSSFKLSQGQIFLHNSVSRSFLMHQMLHPVGAGPSLSSAPLHPCTPYTPWVCLFSEKCSILRNSLFISRTSKDFTL